MKSIEFDTTDSLVMSVNIAGAGVIRNNTNKGIPNGYLTDVKKKDGTNLFVIKQRSTICCHEAKNYITFNACDKIQKVNTYLELTLINGTILRTASAKEVIVK